MDSIWKSKAHWLCTREKAKSITHNDIVSATPFPLMTRLGPGARMSRDDLKKRQFGKFVRPCIPRGWSALHYSRFPKDDGPLREQRREENKSPSSSELSSVKERKGSCGPEFLKAKTESIRRRPQRARTNARHEETSFQSGGFPVLKSRGTFFV